MFQTRTPKAAAMLLVVLAAALGACLLTPGKFTSSLDLRRDGRFSFAYTGEIHMLMLSKLAQMGRKTKTFEPDTCYNDEAKERPCTAEELAEQKKAFEDGAAEREAKSRIEADQMKSLLGGIDPASPQAAEEFAARLRRQAGWKSVVYKGDGLFEVEYAIAGRLDHDFQFPTVERLAMANPFIQANLRNDGSVRIEAPGFSASQGAGNPMTAAMAGLGGAMSGAKGMPALPPALDGTFTITTDGKVLANNTDEGPRADPTGQKLVWTVNVRNAAPTALIKLGN